MTDTAVFSIDLDDAAFKEFAETFKRFQEQAAAMAETWKASDTIIAQALKNLEHMRVPTMSAEPAEQMAESISGSFFSWAGLTKSAKGFGASVQEGTLSLAKWTGLTSVFSGIVAAGGFYGLSRMAAGVAAQRTGAAQLGTTYGGLTSAQVAFGRLGNAEGIMSGLSQALHSAQGMAPLFSLMGQQAENLRGVDSADALAAILPRLKGLADSAAPGNMRDRIRAMGLDRLGVTVETMKMLKGMSSEEVDDMVKTYQENKKHQELSADAQRNLTEFTRTLQAAGAKMTVILGENLVHLTPIVARVAESFAAVLEKLLKDGGPISQWLENLDKNVLEFAGWIRSPDFLRAVDKFVGDVASAGSLFGAIGGVFGFGEEAPRGGGTPGAGGGGSTPPGDAYKQWKRDGGRTPSPQKKLTPWGPSVPWRERGGNTPAAPRGGSTMPMPTPGEGSHELARRIQAARPDLESEQCVALAKAMVGHRGSVTDWRAGAGALDGTLKPGTPVATFLDRQGRPSDRYDGGVGVGKPGNHTTHAAIFESYARDEAGRITGINVWEQFKGSHGPHRRTYPVGGGFGTRDAKNYRAIMHREGGYLGGSRNPMSHPHLQGARSDVSVHDHSDGGARVALESFRIGPMPSSGTRF